MAKVKEEVKVEMRKAFGEGDDDDDKIMRKNIARIANAVQCHN